MDKNAIKKYAVWARNELISRVAQKANQYGITEAEIISASEDSIHGRLLTPAEKKQRTALIARINSKEKNGYQQVIEEVAYTWFNRLTAIRFMEVNGYLPSHVRVFTDEENRFAPQILAEAIHLEMPGLNMEKVYELKQANKTEELYKYLLITQCNALNEILPGMFQKIEDYTELLLPDNLLREGSVIEQMIALIPEEDWTDQVQIIGWLYQYYNSEPKDLVFANLKKNIKITKENIPAATQLFTPDWIVRYMVENSLGRLWVEGHPNDELKANWKYYLEEAEQEESVKSQLKTIRCDYANIKPEEIKVIDPCMGSGHILCYMFDVLVQIYEAYGYTARDAAASIVENNIYGLDIDDRAAQLSYFAVMMKARQYDRRFLSRGIKPNVYAIVESNGISRDTIDYFVDGNKDIEKELALVLLEMKDAKEYGSILKISNINFELLYDRCRAVFDDVSLFRQGVLDELLPLIKVAEILAKKYHATITNPPYMGSGGMTAKLMDYLKDKYPSTMTDLFAVCMERSLSMVKKNAFIAMVTPQAWMFLSSYIKLRELLNVNGSITSMANLGLHAFDGGFGTTAWAYRSGDLSEYIGKYVALDKFGTAEEKEMQLSNADNHYTAKVDLFKKLPNQVYAYWCSEAMADIYVKHPTIKEHYTLESGIKTGKNDLFLRFWHEVSASNTCNSDLTSESLSNPQYVWFKCNKAGGFEKWYGTFEYVIKMGMRGAHIKKVVSKDVLRLRDENNYGKSALTWPHIGDTRFSCKYLPKNVLNDVAADAIYTTSGEADLPLIGLFNSTVFNKMLNMINPTVNYPLDSIGNAHFIRLTEEKKEIIAPIVESCIYLSKTDWDAFETSWDFAKHPLVKYANCLWDATAIGATMNKFYGSDLPKHNSPIELCYLLWQGECADRFATLKANEEELNRLFIDIYGLNDELSPEVADKDVTVRKADLGRDIRSFISYAVGCMFGRYSLNVDGIAYAGGEWNDEKYISFKADKDNVLPICDDEYFEDDIVGKFVKFVEVVFGKDTLEENLKFIADALGGSGSPRDVIRSYFLNDFYADHLKIYQKRPIYWQFDSGKKNGFKCLIYMHRYQPDTIARIRTDYVHEQQARYRTAIADLEQRIQVASTSERVKLTKLLQKLKDQETEIRLFEEKVHHLADQMIRIDLDDGVKHNYEIFKDVLTKIK